MDYKEDWPEARRRLSALWRGERLDRPCIAVHAPRPVTRPTPVPEPADDEARWLDPAYRVALARRQMESQWWGGEAVPSSLLMAGWVNCLGGTPRFAPDTIWFETGEVDFTRPSPFRYDPGQVWERKYRALLLAMCDAAGRDGFLVGSPGGLPACDLLSVHMGTGRFLLALVDHPGWMAEAIAAGAADQLRAKRELGAAVRERHDFWYGIGGWMPFWAPDPFLATQSDVSCMLSPEAFDRFIVPELDVYGRAFGALWYHLDGGDARQHLPRLLSLPYLRVVQYTPAPCEPPNGPAHLEMYRRIQAAGRIVHVALPSGHVEPLVRALDPALLMLDTTCPSRSEGERLLERSAAWSRSAPSARRPKEASPC
jgi:hypothetical protein